MLYPKPACGAPLNAPVLWLGRRRECLLSAHASSLHGSVWFRLVQRDLGGCLGGRPRGRWRRRSGRGHLVPPRRRRRLRRVLGELRRRGGCGGRGAKGILSPAISATAAMVARAPGRKPVGNHDVRVRPRKAAQVRAAVAVIVRRPATTPMPNEGQTTFMTYIPLCTDRDRSTGLRVAGDGGCRAHEDGKRSGVRGRREREKLGWCIVIPNSRFAEPSHRSAKVGSDRPLQAESMAGFLVFRPGADWPPPATCGLENRP